MIQRDDMDLPKQNATFCCKCMNFSHSCISYPQNISAISFASILCAVGYMNVLPTLHEACSICLLLIDSNANSSVDII